MRELSVKLMAKRNNDLPEYAPDSIYKLQIKKGMKFILLQPSCGAKRGDVVKVTTVTSVFKGQSSNGFYNDYEMLRVANEKASWRVDRSVLLPV
jgi:hypothetical protein